MQAESKCSLLLRRLPYFWLTAGIALFSFVFFKNAWVADDAYISFRSIEQLFAGNGPRWNSDERVQVYTSPLWFMLLSGLRVVSSHHVLNAIFLSYACCLAMLFFALKTIKSEQRFFVFVLLLVSISSVMIFSSSGLDDPLLYALLAAYMYYYLPIHTQKEKAFKRLWLMLGLIAITRHDMATLLFFPSFYAGLCFIREYGIARIGKPLALVLLPLLLWTLFSLVYYGMPFPNTAYAKMLHGVPRGELIEFGFLYLRVSLSSDLLAALLLLLPALRVLIKRECSIVFIWLGILSNFIYIVYVGGDFTTGGFTSAVAVFSVLAFFSASEDGVT